MSGLVPLQADIMRYIDTFPSQYDYDLELSPHENVYNAKSLAARRTEIAIQAISFGAEIQTK
jgi:hypothetical protein